MAAAFIIWELDSLGVSQQVLLSCGVPQTVVLLAQTIQLCEHMPRYALHPDDFFEDIKNWKKLGYRVLICCGNSERAERTFNSLEDRKIFSDLGDNFPENFEGVKITSFYLASGFIYHDGKFVLIGTNDLFAKKEREKKIKRRRNDFAVN